MRNRSVGLIKTFLILVSIVFLLTLGIDQKAIEISAHTTGGEFENLNSGKCIDVAGASTANGAQVLQWTCHGGNNQQLRVLPRGGYHEIRFVHSDKCLDVYGLSTEDGGIIVQWACNGGTNQLWIAVFSNGTTERIQNVNSGRCIDVDGQSLSDGAIIHQWGPAGNCGTWASHYWTLNGLSGSSPLNSFGGYSYKNSRCTLPVDPIGTVFILGSGSTGQVFNHAARSDHGSWNDHVAGQYFWETSGCSSADDGAATEPNSCPCDRWHLRYEVAWAGGSYGYSSAATPHFDDFQVDWGVPPNPDHCISPGPPNGFTQGRVEVWNKWVSSGQHPNASVNYWNNTETFSKCGQLVQGDGYVDYIDIRPEH